MKDLTREIEVMSRLDHPHIVKLYGITHSESCTCLPVPHVLPNLLQVLTAVMHILNILSYYSHYESAIWYTSIEQCTSRFLWNMSMTGRQWPLVSVPLPVGLKLVLHVH